METWVAIFTEGEFTELSKRPGRDNAQGFAAGVTCGSGLYGAGSCRAYVLGDENDEKEMRERHPEDEVESAYAALARERG